MPLPARLRRSAAVAFGTLALVQTAGATAETGRLSVFADGERIETKIARILAGGWIHYRFYDKPTATLWVRAGSRYLQQSALLRRRVAGGKVVESIDAFFPFLGAHLSFVVS